MTYKVVYTTTAAKQFKKMDRSIAAFILSFIEDKLVDCENPRAYGKAFQGNLSEIWRYRVGDYRILAKIEDQLLIITVVEVGHRKSIYA